MNFEAYESICEFKVKANGRDLKALHREAEAKIRGTVKTIQVIFKDVIDYNVKEDTYTLSYEVITAVDMSKILGIAPKAKESALPEAI